MVDITKAIESHKKWLSGDECGDLANLLGANLSGADLRGADLRGADLKVYQSGMWTAYVQPDHIRIGCQYYRTEEWEAFSDERIAEMHPFAIDYWKENKHIVISIARSLNKEISA